MADPIISINVQIQDVVELLREMQRRAIDPSPALREIGESVLLSTDIRWEQEISPEGIPWKPNSAYTLAKKRAQGRIQKILQNTGILRASIRYRVDSKRLMIGTNIDYAEKNQAERPFLGFSDADLQEAAQILGDYLAAEKR